MEDQRTLKQNKSLHKFFTILSDQLNTAGLEMKTVLKPDYKIWWTPESIKENIWKPLQKAMLEKESTTELETKDVDRVFKQLQQMFGEKFGLELEFPSEETTPEYVHSYEGDKVETVSLSERILRYAIKYPEWHNGGHFEEMALRAGYKASNASRRLRELHEEGKLDRKEEKSIKGKTKTVWYKIKND